MTTVFEADVIDPATDEHLIVRALSLAELEVDIDLAFGIFTDTFGRDLGALDLVTPG